MSSPDGPPANTTPGWRVDPWGRHQHRWFNGQDWTADIVDNGVQAIDHGSAAPPAPVPACPTVPTPAPSLPSLPPQQPTAPVNQALPGTKIGRAPRSPKPKRRTGRKLVKGALVTVSLLVIAVAAISVLAPPPDDAVDAATVESARVPTLLGDQATHSEQAVSAATFKDDWPFTVDSGTVVCEALPSQLEVYNVFFVDETGEVYPINGIASGRSDKYNWREIEEIWAPDPEIEGARISIGSMIRTGLDICIPAAPFEPGSANDVDTQLSAEITEASAEVWWELTTLEERLEYCSIWQASPDILEAAMITAMDGDDTGWKALEAILIAQC